MKVRCAQCGEELLGAVNRCWKCGREFETLQDGSGLPPVRRQPPAMAAAVSTAVAEPPSRGASPFTRQHTAALDARLGSTPAIPVKPSLKPIRAPDGGAIGAAYSCLMLGIVSVIVSLYTVAALVIAVVGLAMGIWGLHGPRRGTSLFGMILCCVAVAVAGFYGVVQLYTYVYGVSPFAPEMPMDLPFDAQPNVDL